MDLQDVREKKKRKNQILFSRESQCLQDLIRIIRLQKHRTLVLWAFECVNEPLRILKEHYPNENRPEIAVSLCKSWAKGQVKMPEAKRALLQAHAVAKELKDPADIALCHAVGHACATVHVETHALGLPMYELTAVVWQHGIAHCEEAVAEKIQSYITCLNRCAAEIDTKPYEWAAFLMDDNRPNKELLLYEKSRK